MSRKGLGTYTWVLLIVGALLCLAMVPLLIPDSPQDEARRNAAEAVKLCRHAQDDELAELSDRRSIRGMCDQMEAEFRRRYGYAP